MIFAMQISYAAFISVHYRYFFDNPVNSDFGLRTPGSSDPDRHQNLSPWSLGHALPLQEILLKSVHNFFSYQTDRQTNRPK